MAEDVIEDQFREINRLIRLAEVNKALELTVQATLTEVKQHISSYSEMLKMSPTSRRAQYFAALKTVANILNGAADRAQQEDLKKKV